jgi:carbonic anhydrase
VLHHTECALGRLTEAQLHEQISAASGHRFEDALGSFSDPIHAITEDVERIRACPYLPARDKIRGFMYDLTANSVTEVGAAGRGR